MGSPDLTVPRDLPEQLEGRTPAEQVYRFWLRFRVRPDLCKLTPARRKVMERAFAEGYEARDLAVLVLYAHIADEGGPRFWRGENARRRRYLDVVNLFSDRARLAGRIEDAWVWYSARGSGAPQHAEEPKSSTSRLLSLSRRAPSSSWRREERPTFGEE